MKEQDIHNNNLENINKIVEMALDKRNAEFKEKVQNAKRRLKVFVNLTIKLYPHKQGEELAGEINSKIEEIFLEKFGDLK